MKDLLSPLVMSSLEFNQLEEDEVDQLTASEREKLEDSAYAMSTMDEIEHDLGAGGTWEQHWITLDSKGARVFANVYYYGDLGIAVTADGEVVRQFRTDGAY